MTGKESQARVTHVEVVVTGYPKLQREDTLVRSILAVAIPGLICTLAIGWAREKDSIPVEMKPGNISFAESAALLRRSDPDIAVDARLEKQTLFSTAKALNPSDLKWAVAATTGCAWRTVSDVEFLGCDRTAAEGRLRETESSNDRVLHRLMNGLMTTLSQLNDRKREHRPTWLRKPWAAWEGTMKELGDEERDEVYRLYRLWAERQRERRTGISVASAEALANASVIAEPHLVVEVATVSSLRNNPMEGTDNATWERVRSFMWNKEFPDTPYPADTDLYLRRNTYEYLLRPFSATTSWR